MPHPLNKVPHYLLVHQWPLREIDNRSHDENVSRESFLRLLEL